MTSPLEAPGPLRGADGLALVHPAMLLVMADELPPDCARRFRHEKLLASGGFGAVHLACQIGLDRPVAIKLLLARTLQDPEQVSRFLNEARITARLSHPRIVGVLDMGAQTLPWIAYEYIPGPTMRDLARSHPLAWRDALEAMMQVAEALQVAHAQEILHRDIKPENVLQFSPGHYKVADFGIARWTGQNEVHTRTGVIMGTPAYIAPEQVTGDPITPRADVYAVGVMLFELLTGRCPFESDHPLKVLQMQVHEPAPLLSSCRPGLPAGLDRIVAAALAKQPADRTPSAGALRDQLGQILHDAPQRRPGVVAAGAIGRPAAPAPTLGAAPLDTDAGSMNVAGPREAGSSRSRQGRCTPTLASRPPALPASTPRSSRSLQAVAAVIGLTALIGLGLRSVWTRTPSAIGHASPDPELSVAPTPRAAARIPSPGPDSYADMKRRIVDLAGHVQSHRSRLDARMKALDATPMDSKQKRAYIREGRDAADVELGRDLAALSAEFQDVSQRAAVARTSAMSGLLFELVLAGNRLAGSDLVRGDRLRIDEMTVALKSLASVKGRWWAHAVLTRLCEIGRGYEEAARTHAHQALQELEDAAGSGLDEDAGVLGAWLYLRAMDERVCGAAARMPGHRPWVDAMRRAQRARAAGRLDERAREALNGTGL